MKLERPQTDSYQAERDEMVRWQIESRGVKDMRVLTAMRLVPRHLFVDEQNRAAAYQDRPLSIGLNQTISQPYMVAVMSELLELDGHEKVLEIGTGSAYQSAILSILAREVFTLERIPLLSRQAQARLAELGYQNVRIACGDGNLGWKEFAPFDGILVTAAAAEVPLPLLNQLAEGGRLVIPVGSAYPQVLQFWKREQTGFSVRNCMEVMFVPLICDTGKTDQPVPN